MFDYNRGRDFPSGKRVKVHVCVHHSVHGSRGRTVGLDFGVGCAAIACSEIYAQTDGK